MYLKWLLVLMCVALVGCTSPGQQVQRRPGPNASRVNDPVSEDPSCTHHEGCVLTCVIREGEVTAIRFRLDLATGDSTVQGQAFSDLYPPTPPAYVAGASWYIDGEPIVLGGRRYQKLGPLRVVSPERLHRVGEFKGTSVFADTVGTNLDGVVFVPVRPGCEFQPYSLPGYTPPA